MELAHIRLEVLRLAHRHDREPAQVVERARELERYITGADQVNPRRKPKEPVSRDPQQAG